MAYFHLKLVPPRPGFPHDASPEEMTAMQDHAGYWRGLADKGVAIVVGPVFAEGGSFGIAVVEVADAAEAQTLADSDPVITAGLGFRFETSPMPSIILRTSAGGAAAAR
ncbi:YciI family protein [Rhizobium terrae]|uniref:YciI family protein n=1 Tax=Rhizobium terrae TaxID=2171756 RepID=UPI000E3E9B2F|nr:YciI family protein [Rhizobium terrae]